jgi:cyanophycinase
MSPSPSTPAGVPRSRRTLLIIGGAEDKLGRSVVLKRFVRLAGGHGSRIVVIPTASSFSDEAATLYRSVFTRLKAGPHLQIVHPSTRAAAFDPQLVEPIEAATGVFMTGGSQLKLSQNIVGTPVGAAILRAYERGAVVAGTSAGASIMSRFMISLGDEGITPRQRSSQLSAGLGLVDDIVVDQHFDQRGRYGRLMSILANSPNLIGVGIDENTAAEIRDDRFMTVVGAGAIFVADARHAVTDAPDARRGAPLLVSGAVVHTLPAGAVFDLRLVSLVRFVERHPDIGVVVTASHDRASGTASGTSGMPSTPA